jgi:hypothetical protein
MPLPDYEKLGVFYLGKRFDPVARARTNDLILYDSKDLVTHAVCVGMTGSGKTGLCIAMLEEAAIDGIPAIIIDPKGDLANLLLTFPQLRPQDFRPWINEDDARKKGQSPDEFAAAQAALWTRGLAEWGEDGARIQRLRDAADFAIYTPGSSAGIPVSILKSFAAPPPELIEDSESFRDRIATTVGGLLALLGIEADPIQSREHILLSAILSAAWSAGESLDLASLIQRIQQPGFDKLGVMPLESVYPSKDRFGLAMALNNLAAAPGFSAWLEGQPLDIGSMLHTREGKPRHAIFSIAHLSDSERMFFVSLLLNQVLGWVRSQSGTTSLRALVYMDEIAGYFPPIANPPSKQPLLTLMKQARAFGVGVVLATQNPVDLDYKGLSNAGTWLIGRLQTDRDKQRVLDGLEGALGAAGGGGPFDRAAMDRLLSSLGPRLFLMNNVHDDHPEVIESRWCLSYLRGPLTRQQIKALNTPAASQLAPAQPTPGSASPKSEIPDPQSTQPVLPTEIPQYFIPARAIAPGSSLQYRPALLGIAKVYYSDPKVGVDQDESQTLLVPITTGPIPVDWDNAQQVDLTEKDLESRPQPGGTFAPLPSDAAKPKSYAAWSTNLSEALFKIGKLDLFKYAPLKASSKQGESEKDFRLRLSQLVREQRDDQKERLRQKYAPKLAALQDRLRRAQQRVEVEKSQSTGVKVSAALSFGAAILGAFMSRKTISATNISKAATAMKSVGRISKESGDVGRAEESVEAVQQQYNDLEVQFNQEAAAVDTACDPMTDNLDTITLKPKKSNITIRLVALAWAPYSVDRGGGASEAW